MKIQQIPIMQIKPYPKNNRINDETVKVLVKLIKRVGFNVPLVVDLNNVIVKGHARWKAGKLLGMETLPCIVSENTEEVNNADRVADNKISELSKWDADKLMYEIESVEMELKDLGLEFHGLRSEIREVNTADIQDAKDKQGFEDEKELRAVLSVNCPHCGGYFEYVAKNY